MGALYKKEVLVKEDSTITLDAAFTWVENWLESFYTGVNAPAIPSDLKALENAFANQGNQGYSNELRGSKQLNDFFADLFDARDGKVYRIFHSACKQSQGLSKLVYALSPELPNQVGTGDCQCSERLARLESQFKQWEDSQLAAPIVEPDLPNPQTGFEEVLAAKVVSV